MKPTVFFSHSSIDSDGIKPIKDHIIEKTGNAIQIFMSSDGASIPFGKNWLKEIESALTKCKLMFVWLTPNSTKSNWLYFESGYAYSRDIKVVPVGFDGVKLEDLPAPLNLLQGFNINSASSLNNIIAVINQEFGLTFPDLFDEYFYNDVVSKSSSENSPELLEYVKAIKCKFHPKIQMVNGNISSLTPNWLQLVKDILEEKGETFTKEEAIFYGIGFNIYPRSHENYEFAYPEIIIDPLSLNNIFNILSEINHRVYEPNYNNIILAIELNTDYDLARNHFFISSRLRNTEIDFKTDLPNILYRYRNILFRINVTFLRDDPVNSELILIINHNENGQIPLLSLIKLLLMQKVITKSWI